MQKPIITTRTMRENVVDVLAVNCVVYQKMLS